jgi:hypothetical protein
VSVFYSLGPDKWGIIFKYRRKELLIYSQPIYRALGIALHLKLSCSIHGGRNSLFKVLLKVDSTCYNRESQVGVALYLRDHLAVDR